MYEFVLMKLISSKSVTFCWYNTPPTPPTKTKKNKKIITQNKSQKKNHIIGYNSIDMSLSRHYFQLAIWITISGIYIPPYMSAKTLKHRKMCKEHQLIHIFQWQYKWNKVRYIQCFIWHWFCMVNDVIHIQWHNWNP